MQHLKLPKTTLPCVEHNEVRLALEAIGLKMYIDSFNDFEYDNLKEIREFSDKEIKRLLMQTKMSDADAVIFLSSETFRQQPGDKELKSSSATDQPMFPPLSSLPDTSAPKEVETLGSNLVLRLEASDTSYLGNANFLPQGFIFPSGNSLFPSAIKLSIGNGTPVHLWSGDFLGSWMPCFEYVGHESLASHLESYENLSLWYSQKTGKDPFKVNPYISRSMESHRKESYIEFFTALNHLIDNTEQGRIFKHPQQKPEGTQYIEISIDKKGEMKVVSQGTKS